MTLFEILPIVFLLGGAAGGCSAGLHRGGGWIVVGTVGGALGGLAIYAGLVLILVAVIKVSLWREKRRNKATEPS